MNAGLSFDEHLDPRAHELTVVVIRVTADDISRRFAVRRNSFHRVPKVATDTPTSKVARSRQFKPVGSNVVGAAAIGKTAM